MIKLRSRHVVGCEISTSDRSARDKSAIDRSTQGRTGFGLCLRFAVFALVGISTVATPPVVSWARQESTEATNTDEPQLKFSFHQQPWEDVLNWFARQADLSLVINQVPPGEFTFSDTRGYSPAQSIDLLNSVLMTKEFTLVRKDKMLIVLPTKDGVPYDLIPQVSTEELKTRGRFELVSVTFPLEGRTMETVENEIKPLIGTLGRVFPMPATGKIQVTETAGKLSAIDALIQSIPKPQPPKKPDPKPEPPKQVLKPYAVKDLDLEPTTQLLSKAVGGIQATADQTSNQIFIYATDAQHEAVARVLETLRANPQPDSVSVQAYEYHTAVPTTLVQQLAKIAPAAVMQIDAASRRLIVVATETEQQNLKQAMEEIEGPASSSLQLQAYDVAVLSQPQVTKAITEIVPGASVTPQTEPEKLLVIANGQQQQQIATLIEQFREQGLLSDLSDKKLEVFEVENLPLATAVALLKPLHPQIEFTSDAANQRLLAMADADTAARIREALTQLDTRPKPALQPVLKTYPSSAAQYKKLTPLLPKLAPNAQVTWDNASQLLLVIADEKGHSELQSVLDSIAGMGTEPAPATLKVFAVTPEQKQRFTTIFPTLTDRLAEVQIVPDTDPRRLTVWASESQLQELSTILESLQVADNEMTKRSLAVYSVADENAATIYQTLLKLFPTIDIVLEPETQRLVVWGTASEQAEVKAAVAKLQLDSHSTSKQPSIQAYPLQKLDPTIARQAVTALVPELTLTIDAANNSLIAWGKDRDHKKLALLLQQMEATTGTDEKSMQVYDAVDQDPVDLSRIIQQMAPKAIVSADRRSKGIAVWATNEEHQLIEPAVKQLSELGNEDKRELKSLNTVHTGATIASQLLKGIAPEAAFFPSKDNRTVFSYAVPKDQPRIQSVMEQLEASNANATNDEIRAYTFRKSILTTAKPILTTRLPKAQWMETGAADQWIVMASAEDQQVIQQVLDDLSKSLPESSEQSLSVYSLQKVTPVDAKATITSLVGTVTYLESPVPEQLRVFATEHQHQQIANLLEQLQSQLTDKDESRPLQVYAIDPATDVATVYQSLDAQTLATMTVIQNVPRNALIVRASPEKHEQLKQEIDAFLAALPEKLDRVPKVYPLQNVAPESARLLLITLVPTATYAVDATNGNLAATALPEEHKQIEAAIRQIDVANDTPLETKAYRVPMGYATAIQSSLLPMYPQAKISTDYTASTLIVAATEKQHSEIKQIIDDVLLGSAQDRSSVVYTLRVANPQSVLGVLKQVFPQSQATADGSSGSVVVTASALEHESIAKLLDDLDTAGKDRTAEVYRLRNANPRAAQQALADALPRASITVDRTSGLLIATATAEDHQQIQQTIDRMEASENEDLQTTAYTLTGADPRSAQSALESLLPSAQFAADPQAGLLIATATAKQHLRIQAVVDQMENSDTDKPHARAIEIDGGNSERLYSMLSRMYRWDDKVRFTYESTSGTIMFIGPKRQEEAVMELVDQWNAVVKKEQPRDVKVYELMEVDGDAIVESLTELFEEQAPKPDLQVQWYTNKLIAVATPEQHLMIDKTIQQIRGQQRELEVFTLMVNSPETVEDAIDQMFIDLPSGGSPSITASTETQQLFIRATEEQLGEIRSLLVKLGEPAEVANGSQDGMTGPANGIGRPLSVQGKGNVRVFSAPNSAQLLQQLKQVWPQISNTPLKIMSENANRDSMNPGGTTEPLPSSDSPSEVLPNTSQPNSGADSIADPSKETATSLPPIRTSVDVSIAENVQDESSASPLIVIPGDGQLTVASEDLQSLQIFQELFAVLQQQADNEGKTEITGNFTIFQLNNAGAGEIAESVNRLFQQVSGSQGRGRSRGESRSRVSIVADERLNALIVYGPPNDRRTIEQLIKVLDTSEIPIASNRLNQPRIVAVKNVEAERIMDVLESVYRSQLRPDQPPRIQIPAGVSVEVAVALREMNAAATAPLLTLEVDQATNSIIVLASERLGTEVESLIERLDQQNKDANARSIRVIPLENSNTQRIEEALQQLMRRSRRGRQ